MYGPEDDEQFDQWADEKQKMLKQLEAATA